jgi:hypothetical protein
VIQKHTKNSLGVNVHSPRLGILFSDYFAIVKPAVYTGTKLQILELFSIWKIVISDLLDTESRKFCFMIRFDGNKEFVFGANSHNDKQAWISKFADTLNKAIMNLSESKLFATSRSTDNLSSAIMKSSLNKSGSTSEFDTKNTRQLSNGVAHTSGLSNDISTCMVGTDSEIDSKIEFTIPNFSQDCDLNLKLQIQSTPPVIAISPASKTKKALVISQPIQVKSNGVVIKSQYVVQQNKEAQQQAYSSQDVSRVPPPIPQSRSKPTSNNGQDTFNANSGM